jgi:L-lactate dehydrogenase complex protein LldE
VAFFVTCMVDQLYPDVGIAAVDLLERFGTDVVFPDAQTCCGQPAFNAGYRAEARAMAIHFIDVFWPLLDAGEVDAIVAPSGSCVAMVKNHYPLLFETEHDVQYLARSVAVADSVYELTQYLVDVLGIEDTAASFSERLAFHPCCHLQRELDVDAQPRVLLSNLRNAEVVDLPNETECCGFGGLFALKNAEISVEIGRRKVRNIDASGADFVAVNDVSCMAHMNGILKREGKSQRVVHVAELLNGNRSQ